MSSDRRRVTVFLSVPRSEKLLRDVRASGIIATVFSLPTTLETLQLKATDATIVPLVEGDRDIMLRYGAGFVAELRRLGYDEVFARAVASAMPEEIVGIAFTPTAAFVQTPGPGERGPVRLPCSHGPTFR